jgi:hypothetical protein
MARKMSTEARRGSPRIGPKRAIRPRASRGVLFVQLPVDGHYFRDLFPAFIISGRPT